MASTVCSQETWPLWRGAEAALEQRTPRREPELVADRYALIRMVGVRDNDLRDTGFARGSADGDDLVPAEVARGEHEVVTGDGREHAREGIHRPQPHDARTVARRDLDRLRAVDADGVNIQVVGPAHELARAGGGLSGRGTRAGPRGGARRAGSRAP